MTFGQKLRELRRASGLTQRELASAADLDFSYISKLENDRNPPPAADTVVRLGDAMKVPAEALLALTAKLPSDVRETVSANEAAQEFLRESHRLRLTDREWRQLSREVRRLRGEDA
jgi:HTH-type transcriptional regulator, competence development regulator